MPVRYRADLLGAQRQAPGVVPFGLLLAEVRANLREAFAAIADFGLLPGFSGLVEGGLRDAVEYAGPRPLARIRGQARQAEHGVGDAEALAAAAAHPQRVLEGGPRAVVVAVLAPHPAQVDRHLVVCCRCGPIVLGAAFEELSIVADDLVHED